MAWLRYGDEFTHDRRWDGVPYDARWHYLSLVAACSKAERFDCRIPVRLADRASDVPDPGAATEALVAAGFLQVEDGDVVIVDGEARHMPPEGQRDRKRKEDQRQRTHRHRLQKCQSGQHDEHCPKPTCPARSGNAPGNALPSSAGNTAPAEPRTDFDPHTGEIHEASPLGNAAGNALPQDRTGQDRTALGVGVSLGRNQATHSDLELAARRFLPPAGEVA
jgi:hypothetical protein